MKLGELKPLPDKRIEELEKEIENSTIIILSSQIDLTINSHFFKIMLLLDKLGVL